MPKKEWSIEVRAKVVALRQAGNTWEQIKEATGAPCSTANQIMAKAMATNSVQNKKRSGRPKKFTKQVKTYMDQAMRAHPEYTAKDVKDKLVQRFGGTFETAESSVCKVWKQLGYTPSKGLGQDHLSDTHKKQRVDYCKRHLKDQFSNVVFTDEKPFVLGKIRG
jgi:transposase